MKKILLLLATMCALTNSVRAQYAFHAAYHAEKVHSNLVTSISSGQTITNVSPYQVAVTVGTGKMFDSIISKSPSHRMWLVCYPPTTGYPVENSASPIEIFECAAVSNDT